MNLPTLPPGLTLDAIRAGVVVACDPGLRYPAVAIARQGIVVHAARVKIPGALAKLPTGERCRQIVDLVGAHVLPWTAPHDITALCVERPQIYVAARSKGDPNDLIPLAMIIGGVATGFRVPVIAPVPRDWIGGIPKSTTGDPWSSPRGAVLARKLSVEERACVESTHDGLDAVGLLLHSLGRLTKNFPGST